MDVHAAADESVEVVDRDNALQRLALVGPLRSPIMIAEIRVCGEASLTSVCAGSVNKYSDAYSSAPRRYYHRHDDH
jgi:hypothetical protein